MKKRIVIFASGSGTNAQNIIEYFNQKDFAEVVHVFSNKKNAPVLERSRHLNINASTFSKEELSTSEIILEKLQTLQPDIIVLAGFLLKFPHHILKYFPNKVINIHPALLPKYGGKGMYGNFVHEAVVRNGETSTGITIHFVNEFYDDGAIIFQKAVAVSPSDNAQEVAKKVQNLEYKYYPKVIENLLRSEKNEFNFD